MSRVATIRELAGSGQVNPQELKAIQSKRETQAREARRAGEVSALIGDAVSKTSPRATEAQQDLAEWHRLEERAFLKAAIHTDDPDQFLDGETIPVSMARLRKMARSYADVALELHATDARIAKLRSECFEEVNDTVNGLREELAAAIAPSIVAIGATTSTLRQGVRDKVR